MQVIENHNFTEPNDEGHIYFHDLAGGDGVSIRAIVHKLTKPC